MRTALVGALLAAAYATKPSAASLRAVLASFIRRREGMLGEVLARGAMAVEELAGLNGTIFTDCKFFMLAKIDPGSLFEEPDGFLGAVGLFGHWLAVRVRQPDGAPRLLYLGSAVV
mmetsp:Transcript_25585/g.59639  ORF Transcript_25585/g.59639 Transcript_25585/m.59639 type:complete len:116 (-) Transcript_25585:70-417(-)